jgi:hypothetical protein
MGLIESGATTPNEHLCKTPLPPFFHTCGSHLIAADPLL